MKASYKTYKTHFNEYACEFLIGGKPDHGAHGTSGTGCKLYETEAKATAAGKRYLKKMKNNGFEI